MNAIERAEAFHETLISIYLKTELEASGSPNVHFGSLADICGATDDVRFAPNSDRESGHPQNVMSALPPKADMCGALAHVCFGPIADISVPIKRSI